MYTLTPSYCISFKDEGGLESTNHLPVKYVDQIPFFRLAKQAECVNVLFPNASDRSPFQKTTLIESITLLRDSEFRLKVGARTTRGHTKKIKYDDKAKVMTLTITNTVGSVELPPKEGENSKVLRILMDKPGSPLWVECSQDTMEYLGKVLRAEHARGQVVKPANHLAKPESERINLGIPKLSPLYKWGVFRVFRTLEDGTVQSKHLKMSLGEDAVRSQAESFIRGDDDNNEPSVAAESVAGPAAESVEGPMEDQPTEDGDELMEENCADCEEVEPDTHCDI